MTRLVRLASFRRSVATAIAALILASTSIADEAPALQVGSRVRVAVPSTAESGFGYRVLTGTLVSLDETALTLESEGDGQSTIPGESLASLHVSLGPSKRGEGAMMGLGIGFATGMITGFALGDDDAELIRFTAGQKGLILGVPLAALGVVVGAIAGAERWKHVPSDSLHLGYSGADGRQVFVALRF